MDIVEQLRKSANTIYYQDGYTFRLGLQNEAANEIERLREALKKILTHEADYDPSDCIEIARAALKESE
jgi:hypothetical protein